jgi:hypothetical protein
MKKIIGALLIAASALTPLAAAYAQSDVRERGREEGAERAPRGPEVRQMDSRQNRAETPRNLREGGTREERGRRGDDLDRDRDGNVDRRWDRNRDGNVDRNWDRNNNGRVDRQWDRNRDGDLDRRWDRNDNNRLDRRYDRNRDGNLDRRYDRDRDGQANRYDRRDNRSWNRSWRNDRRYDWNRYRDSNRSFYRQGRYYAPYRDHRYSRFSIGIRIGSPFYGQRYWINDPWRYRLPDVYGDYRWVRYYDDVLLVDTYSGEVVDVIHNFFW